MIGFIVRYRMAIMAFVVIGLLGGLWYHGFQNGYNKRDVEFKIEAATVAEKRNEILNNRPDARGFLDGLLKDKDW